MSAGSRHYLSYLLRLWQEPHTPPGTWRASLQNSQTGELSGFADVAQLFAFLEQQLDPTTGPTGIELRTRKRIAETGGNDDSDHYTGNLTERGATPIE